MVSAKASIYSRCELSRRDLITDLKRFRGLAIRISALQREFVCLHEQRLVLELFLNPADRGLHRAVVEPVAHPQREEVLAAVHRFRVEAQMFERAPRQTLQFHRKQPELIE